MTELAKPRIVAAIAEPQPATLRFAIDEANHFGYDLEVLHCAGYVHYETRVLNNLYFDNWLEAADHVLEDAKASRPHIRENQDGWSEPTTISAASVETSNNSSIGE